MNSISFIGAGCLGQTLARAFSNASWPVTCISSRTEKSAAQLADLLPGCRATSLDEAAQCDFVFLTVPDDVIGTLAAELSWRSNQMVVHCSGATEISALGSAANRGALTGCFHPLQIFSNPNVALQQLPGSSVAIEGSVELMYILRDMANALGLRTIQVPPGGRALYHAGASYAASLILPLLHEAVQLWRHLGINEDEALAALLPLVRGTCKMVESKGLAGALSGPVSRGDLGVVHRHWAALSALGPSHVTLYTELTKRQLSLAVASERMDTRQARQWSLQLDHWGEDLPTAVIDKAQ